VPASELGFDTASWGRRALALFVDWIVSTLVVIAVIGLDDYSNRSDSGFVVLGVFVLETAMFVAFLGGSFGQLATRLRVVSTQGRGHVPPLKALLRQVLIALVVPPLVFRPDGRGLHDLAAGSATVTLQTWQGLTQQGVRTS
jgi:uncharacterized RDD family membrane protein YckC